MSHADYFAARERELAREPSGARHDEGCMCPDCRPELSDDAPPCDAWRAIVSYERLHSAAVLG